jgi:uncharacterized protein (DUF4213/DUF364 family)
MMAKRILERAYDTVLRLQQAEGIEGGTLVKIAIKTPWNVVLGTNHQAGMAFNFTGEHAVGALSHTDDMIPELQAFVGRPLTDLVERFLHADDSQRRAICLAAMNALSHPLLSPERIVRAGFRCQNATMQPLSAPSDIVAVVGYGGAVRQYLGKCRELHVTDLRPRRTFQTTIIGTQVETGPKTLFFHPAEENRQVLSNADVVLITGSTLVNGTYDEVVAYARKARVRAVYGPSAQLPPEFFFENGLTHVLSTVIRDVDRFEYDMVNDVDMEGAIRAHQGMLDISRG